MQRVRNSSSKKLDRDISEGQEKAELQKETQLYGESDASDSDYCATAAPTVAVVKRFFEKVLVKFPAWKSWSFFGVLVRRSSNQAGRELPFFLYADGWASTF